MAGFIATMRREFGRPGQTIKEFKAEYDELNAEDRKWYHSALLEAGLDVDPPKETGVAA